MLPISLSWEQINNTTTWTNDINDLELKTFISSTWTFWWKMLTQSTAHLVWFMYISYPDTCHEFGHGDDANAWRKSTKEAEKTKIFYCNLESRNLFNHLRHQRTNSRQITSAKVFDYAACNWFNKFVCIISLWFSITWLCSSLMWSQDKEKWTKTIFRSERQIINGLF